MLVVILRLIVVIVRTRNGERIELVVSRSRSDVSITRSPIDGAVHDGWPVQHRAPARKAPEDVSADRVQRVRRHVARHLLLSFETARSRSNRTCASAGSRSRAPPLRRPIPDPERCARASALRPGAFAGWRLSPRASGGGPR